MNPTETMLPIERAISDRARRVTAGERGQLLDMAAGVKDLIPLARGDPDLATPVHIVDAAKRALDEGQTHYTHWAGTLELRRAITDKLRRDNNIEVDPETEVLVTSGAQEAVYLSCLGLLDSGDEILVPDPHYMTYDTAIALAGARAVFVPTSEADDFEVRADQLERFITERTKAILLVSPNNPTGGIVHPDTVREIAALAKKHDLMVISDEIYEKIVFDSPQLLSIASLPGMRGRTVTINGFSKSYSMTGWRVGYLAAPASFIRALEAPKHTISICASAVSQAAALAALTGPQECVADAVATYAKRRDGLMKGLDEIGLTYSRPWGTFYIFANVRSTGLSSLGFAVHVLETAGVLVLPGTAFGPGGEGFVRFSLVRPIDQIEEAIKRMRVALTAGDRGVAHTGD
ncbi:MAG: pyridoxal phosphate-dependent aminotransferase [Ardenticatenaceae bacterium]|nr:pyridoxal phosphate-dependent aminotransferase [Ardenticatenaceae bacterium]